MREAGWEGGDPRTRLSYVHRTTDDADIYFVVNDHERWEHVEGIFRVRGRAPEVWDPSAGTSRPERRYAAAFQSASAGLFTDTQSPLNSTVVTAFSALTPSSL